MDGDGGIVEKSRIKTEKEAIEDFFSDKEGRVVMESTGIWEYVYELIEGKGLEVYLANPLKVRAIAEAKIKTDKIDSEILAHLLRANLLPTVWIGDKGMRDLKRLIMERAFLKRSSTMMKNRIHAELARRGTKTEGNIFTIKRRAYLRSLSIKSVDRLLTILDGIDEQIKEVNEELLDYYSNSEDAKILTTMCGIGFYSALSITAVIGNINRFSDSEHLCSYFGLVPSTHQSSLTTYHGSITKEGSRTIRWLLIQCAWVHVTKCKDTSLTTFYNRIARKKGKRKAIVATARKMVKIIYWMLKEKEPYHVEGYKPRSGHAR